MMRIALGKFAPAFTGAVLVASLGVPRSLIAQAVPHVVSSTDLEKATADASTTRQQNLDSLNRFLSSDQARRAMQSARINPQQVKNAVTGLTDEELAQLASRANKAQSGFAAGSLGDRDLIIIILAIVALILIIVAVR